MNLQNHWIRLCGGIGLGLLGWAHYQGLFVAPPEAMMGDVGRILYAHVPTAWITLLAYLAAFIAAVGALYTAKRGWDALVEATVEVGVVLNALLLVQGSLWAKPTWGVFWTWDPRLTTSAIMVVAFGVVLALRRAIHEPGRRLTISGVATIVAFVNVPIVYLSVKWWRTLHQPYSSPQTVDSAMVTPLRMAAIGLLLLGISLVATRWRIAMASLEREQDAPDIPQASEPLAMTDNIEHRVDQGREE